MSNPFYAQTNSDGRFQVDMSTMTSRKMAMELIQDSHVQLRDARRLLEFEGEELKTMRNTLAEVEGQLLELLLTEGRH